MVVCGLSAAVGLSHGPLPVAAALPASCSSPRSSAVRAVLRCGTRTGSTRRPTGPSWRSRRSRRTSTSTTRRIVVSVFMSIWNVHVNWFPVSGTVDYFRHHHGMFMVAWHPKSSEDNERTTTVIDMGGQKILFRQIAGLVARRIVSYARVGGRAEQNTQCGFIKFGSRGRICSFRRMPTCRCVWATRSSVRRRSIARLKKKE